MVTADFQHTANTAIIGAGITGLCVAHALHKSGQGGQSFDLLESSSEVGGAIQSIHQAGYLAESGPNSLLVKDKRVAALLDEVGLQEGLDNGELMLARPEAKKRYIVQNGTPIAMPGSPMGIIGCPLFSARGKLRLLLEPFISRHKATSKAGHEESFAGFVRRRLGPEMLASAAGPFVSGIYAGDPEKLSARHAFPRLWSLEKRYGSVIVGAIAKQLGLGRDENHFGPSKIVSFRSGMHAMPQAIADGLPEASVHLGAKIQSINGRDTGWQLTWKDVSGQLHEGNYRNLVITVPPHRLAGLLLPSPVLDKLKPVMEMQSPPVTSLVLGFKREEVAHPLDGFGMLIKQAEQNPLLGVLFSSSMFEGRAPEGHVTLTCMMGGSIHPDYSRNNDQTVLEELRKLLGVTGNPTFHHQTSWPHAIPQYGLDYQEKLDVLEACEQTYPGLHLAGNYRGGISVGDCMINGLELGKRLAAAPIT